MTSQLKIRCLLKTTAKRFWTRQRGEEKKSCCEKGGGGGGGVAACDRKSEFVRVTSAETFSISVSDRRHWVELSGEFSRR